MWFCVDNHICRYELYGVVAHSGRLASCGHYVAYVRDREADPTGADTAMKEAFQTMSRSAPGTETVVTL